MDLNPSVKYQTKSDKIRQNGSKETDKMAQKKNFGILGIFSLSNTLKRNERKKSMFCIQLYLTSFYATFQSSGLCTAWPLNSSYFLMILVSDHVTGNKTLTAN